MIGMLLVSSSLMILMIVVVLYLAVSFKTWANKKEEEMKGMARRIDETQSLFKKEITQLLQNVNKIINYKNDKI